jgi:hypothetical protein
VVAPSALTTYMALVRVLRHRRRDRCLQQFEKKYGATDRAALSKMTVDDDWPILRDLSELEFPSIFSAFVFFALFKAWMD